MEVTGNEELIELGISIEDNQYYKKACQYISTDKNQAISRKVSETAKNKMHKFLDQNKYDLARAWIKQLIKGSHFKDDFLYASIVLATDDFRRLDMDQYQIFQETFDALKKSKDKNLYDRFCQGKQKLYSQYFRALQTAHDSHYIKMYYEKLKYLTEASDASSALWALKNETKDYTNMEALNYEIYFYDAISKTSDPSAKAELIAKEKSYIEKINTYRQNRKKEDTYLTEIKNYKTGYWAKALESFKEIPDYKDSSAYIKKCEEQIKEHARKATAKKKSDERKQVALHLLIYLVLTLLYAGINLAAGLLGIVRIAILSWGIISIAAYRKKAALASIAYFTDFHSLFAIDDKIMGTVLATLFLFAIPFILLYTLILITKKTKKALSAVLTLVIIGAGLLLYLPVTRYSNGLKAYNAGDYTLASKKLW